MASALDPKISVVMPVYNGGQYLVEAIKSILDQTYSDFELIIVNDGSSDNSEVVVKSFSDKRILYLKNEVNKGLIFTLNKGISLSKGTFIARMDQDDISDVKRFEKQLIEFNNDPQLVICGSFIKTFENNKEEFISHMPVSHAQIISSIFFTCPFAHPSVMMKKETLLKLDAVYREDYPHSEDYDLWSRLVFLGNCKNIPEYLLSYRVHGNQVSTVYETQKYNTVTKIQTNILSRFDIIPSASESAVLLNLFKGISRKDRAYLKETALLINKLYTHFVQKYPQYKDTHAQILVSRWFRVCGNSGLGISNIKNAFSLSFFRLKYLKFKDVIKLLYKTVINYQQIEKQNG
jgi:glycosyltransferase involved in cell wall biosynthesis